MRIAFFGTPEFAAQLLQRVLTDLSSVEVALVVTQPDKKVGRKQLLTPSPVKVLARENSLDIFDHPKLTDLPEILREKKIDLALLYAYGKIIPASVLAAPRHGFWNIHPSLLPVYRGSSPLTFPLVLGDTETGVSLMEMDEQLDHGPVILQQRYTIKEHDTHHTLETILTDIGFRLFKKALETIDTATLDPQPQDHQKATTTRLLRKEDGFIPFAIVAGIVRGIPIQAHYTPAIVEDYYKRNPEVQARNLSINEAVYNLYRALQGWPGIWTIAPIGGRDTRIKLTKMHKQQGTLTIERLQMEGKNEVDFETFNRAYSVFTSAAL